MADLTAYVEALRSATGGDVPDFDPESAGVHARALLLLEAPGARSAVAQMRHDKHGSGFISLDNDDRSAEALWQLYREAELDRGQTLIWNIVPWYIGSATRIRTPGRDDLSEAEPYLDQLLRLLPKVEVVLTLGRKAQDGWFSYLRREEAPLLPTLVAPHPSPQVLQTNPERRREILDGLRRVRWALSLC